MSQMVTLFHYVTPPPPPPWGKKDQKLKIYSLKVLNI